jgi:transposase
MKYTIAQFRKDYPTDEACLERLFRQKFPRAEGYYRIKNRMCYSHKTTRHQVHPLAGTIFEKTSTPLTLWFHAIYLFSTSKNGVSAKELQRQLGVTYKTAWRMAHQIRKLMEQGSDPLSGVVEVDETYFGRRGDNERKFKNKAALIGAVERKGKVRVKKAPNRRAEIVLPFVKENVERGAHIMTDEYSAYGRLTGSAYGYAHTSVKHGKKHYTWGDSHTNTIEGFWGQFKRSVRGTYSFVSSQHLQAYVNEFAFRYNYRASSIFDQLLARI